MTKEELKQKIDEYFGLVSELIQTRSDEARLVYLSPTNVIMFDILIVNFDDGWGFGGHSGAVPDSWKTLNRLGK